MLVNGKQARELWCCQSFDTKRARCIASQCMAWRWVEETPNVCVKCGTEEEYHEDRPEEREGYCGLAGLPKW